MDVNSAYAQEAKLDLMGEAAILKKWYLENYRTLPWRQSRDPYRIWISEMMLQQTTVTAVVPYYERFLLKFPDIKSLQKAPLSDVLEMWSGLGYYSRARNIHKAAQTLAVQGFPKSYKDLMELPGFGPYTARAVSSLAFGEKAGVVDGNVIRVMSRYYGWSVPWWNPKDKIIFQEKADELVKVEDPSLINQALMELGATVCTPHNPACLMCPLQKNCQARKTQTIHELPLKKLKKKSEIWLWNAEICLRKNQIGLVENNYMPFLKGQFVFPGKALKQSKKPAKYDVKHGITHHDIYVRVKKLKTAKKVKWIHLEDIKKINPSSLLRKILEVI
jgi:A/G-specific adenine glycosylase